MKIKDLINAYPILVKLMNQEMSLSTLYKLSGKLDDLDRTITFYETNRAKLLDKYFTTTDEGFKANDENTEACNKEFEELINIEVDNSEDFPIVIPSTEDVKLSYMELKAIAEFVKIGE